MLDRIKELAAKNGYTFASLEKECGFGNGTLKRWGEQSPSLNKVIRLANVLNTSVEYLATGQEHKSEHDPHAQEILSIYDNVDEEGRVMMRATAYYARDRVFQATKGKDGITIPSTQDDDAVIQFAVYNAPASAGTGQFLDTDDYTVMEFPAKDVPRGAAFGIRIKGDSMTPLIHDGDIVFIQQRQTLDDNEVGVVLHNGDCYCKRFVRDGDAAFLISNNPQYDPIPIEEYDEVRVLGKVVGTYKQ